MRFLTFTYLSFLTIFSSVHSVAKASLSDDLPMPDFSAVDPMPSAPSKTVQQIVDGWDGSRSWMTEGRLLLFDTETTGVSSFDRIVQISFYEVINGKFTGQAFNSYINPCRSISKRAYEAHDLTRDFLKTKPKFADVFSTIRAFCGENPLLVAHNAQFDIRMLRQEIQRLDAILPWAVSYKCTLGMARRDYKRTLDPNLNIFSPVKQETFKPVSYAERQRQLRDRQSHKIEKAWKRQESFGRRQQKRTGLSQEEARDARKRQRSASRDRYLADDGGQENRSPNVVLSSPSSSPKFKRQRASARPSFALGNLLRRIDASPRKAVRKHGHDLPKLCEENGIPLERQKPHDGFWDTAMLVALTDHLSSSSDSSQPSSQDTAEEDDDILGLFLDPADDGELFTF
tara:strand:- start:971 stop:2170 length:1200 start_codon:yes stop_codon:yes gene_type:complete